MTAPAESPVLTVSLDSCDAAASARQRSVLASVPRRFLLAEGEASDRTADVVVLSGQDPDWPDTVVRVVDDGARGVLVVDPGLADPERVRRLSGAVAGRAVVAVESVYAGDRTWTAARGEVAADAATASIVDSLASVPADSAVEPLVSALVSQLAVVRPLVGSLGGLRLLHRGAREYLLAAPTAGPRVTLAGVASAAGREGLTLDVVAPARRWEVRFDETALGSPAQVTAYDETGARTRPLVHESGRRMTWQRLHEALTGDGAGSYGLDDLADDLELAGRALS
jgi:hypothetical protein